MRHVLSPSVWCTTKQHPKVIGGYGAAFVLIDHPQGWAKGTGAARSSLRGCAPIAELRRDTVEPSELRTVPWPKMTLTSPGRAL